MSGLGGDLISRGFYVTNYAGYSLDTVTLGYGASTAGSYTVTLTARLNAYNGTIIGTPQTRTFSAPAVASSETLVTFNFSGATVPVGSTVTFTQQLVSGPGNLYYDLGFGPCINIVETNGTAAPLDTVRGSLVGLTITGSNLPPPVICSFSLTAPSFEVTADGGTSSVGVNASLGSCSWSVVNNSPSCLYNVSPSGGTGNGSVLFSVAGNAGSTPVPCSLTIAGITFPVTLDGCVFSLSTPSASYGAAGGSSSVGLNASGFGCIWVAVSDSLWITVTSASGGSGNTTLSYSVAANPDAAARTGHITIGGRTFTITQSGSSPPPAAACTPVNVYRYRNTGILGHFYTTSLGEGSALIAAGAPLVLEGPGFAACSGGTTAAGIFPVERFKHLVVPGVYFYSMIPSEIDTVRTSYSAILQDQGIGFYALNFQPAGTYPVYRFRNTTVGGANFYTIIPSERDFIIANFPGYAYEGIGFWAMPPF
jgi:hypothetical protein